MLKILMALFAAALGVAAAPAMAASLSGGSGISSPTNTLDFSELSLLSGSALTNQFNASGIDFAGLYYDPCPDCTQTYPTGARPNAGNFMGLSNIDGGSAGVVFDFAAQATDFSFSFASDGATFQLASYLNGNLVESFSIDGAVWQTYGFTGSLFDEVRIAYTPVAGRTELLVDDLKWNMVTTPVPEPEVYAMMAMGLGLLGFVRRRKQTAA